MEDNAQELLNGTLTGTVNGRYRIVRELGQGGMGIVYLVQDTARNDKELVLKIFHPRHSDPETINVLRREFAILSALRHPNLVRVYDFAKFTGPDAFFYTMEYIQGREFFQSVQDLSTEALQALFIQVVQALGYIHASGILHGDIKSENIMVRTDTETPSIKLMDFGLAVREDERIKQTLSGTLEYMAPELFQQGKVSISSDLYALGILMYWAFAGKAPFTGTPEEIKKGHLRTLPPRLSSLGIKIPARLEAVIQRLLAKDPIERFGSCEELLTAIGIEDHDSSKTRDLITPLIMDSFLKVRDEQIKVLLQQIDENLQPGHEHRPNFITISGTEGSGQYRILQDVKSKIQLDNITVLEGWCSDDTFSVYQPLIDAFKGFPDLEKAISRIDRALNDSRAGHDDFELVRFQYMEEIASCLRDLSRRQRTVLIIRTFEGANEAVIDLVYFIGRALKDERLAILVSITTDRQSETNALRIQRGRDSLSNVYDFTVKRLVVTELDELIPLAFEPSFFPQGFTKELYEKSGGNIEIVAAIMTALNNAGYFIRSDRTWMLSEIYDLSQLDLSTVSDIYLETYRNLSEEQQSILQYIAVYDAFMDKRFLHFLTNLDDEGLEHALNILMLRRLLVTQEYHEHAHFGFLSNAFQVVVFEQIDQERLATMRQRIVEHINLHPDIEHAVDQRAVSFLNAGIIDQGLRLALQALKGLKHSYSNRRALIIAELALLKCPVEYKRYYRIFKRNVADLQDTRGNTKQALELYQDLLGLYKDGVAKSALLRKTSYFHQTLGQIDEARQVLDQALQQVNDHDKIERALILREICWIYIIQGNYKQAITIGIQALKVLPENSPTRTLAITLNTLGGASFYAGDIQKAIEYFTLSAKVKEQLGDKRSQAATLNNLGIVYNVSGDHEKASQYWRSSMEIMETVGDWAGLAENYNNLGILLMDSGHYERALIYYKKCLDLKNRIGDLRGIVASHCNIGELLYLREDFSGAIQVLNEGIKFAERIQSNSNKAEMLYHLGRVFLALNQLQKSKIAIDGCLNIVQNLQDKSKLGEFLVLRARVHYLETGELENDYLKQAETLNSEQPNQTLGMLVHLYYAENRINSDDVQSAIKMFPQLHDFLETSNLKYYQLNILLLLARAMVKTSKPLPVIEKTLERAEKLANTMGLMLKMKTIYYLRGQMAGMQGDNINSYKHYRKAYQCLKLCLTHIDAEQCKQSLVALEENVNLLESIKRVKSNLSAA